MSNVKLFHTRWTYGTSSNITKQEFDVVNEDSGVEDLYLEVKYEDKIYYVEIPNSGKPTIETKKPEMWDYATRQINSSEVLKQQNDLTQQLAKAEESSKGLKK